MNEQNKRCPGYAPAGIEAHITSILNFRNNNSTKDGKHNKCKICDAAYRKHRYNNDKKYRLKEIERILSKRTPEINKIYNDKRYAGGPLHASYAKARNKRRHLQKEAPFDETVTRELVWQYGLGLCHICWKPVAFEHVTMEHMIPLCKGGGWTWDNIRPAHAYCNGKKGRKSMDELENRGILKELRDVRNHRMNLKAIEGVV